MINPMERISKGESRLLQVIEATPNGIIMVDREGTITLCNAEVVNLFGYSKEDLIGESIEVLVPHRFRNKHPSYRSTFFHAPETRQMGIGRDLYGLRRDGREFPIEIGLNPMQTDEGTFVLASIVDITKRKELEETLLESSKALQEKNEEMEQFVYTVSHDLKSPLVTSAGFLGLLRQDLETRNFEQAEDSIARLEKANKRMEQLINDLLQLSRVGRLEMEISNVNIQEVVNGILDNLNERISQIGASILIAPDLPMVQGDRSRIYQALENLVINALKYGCTNDDKRIEIGSENTPTFSKLFVRDHGPGIDREYHEKVFGLFQLLESPTSSTQGTGVGLAIVSRIMQLHGGKASLTSDPGSGCTFWLEFPKQQRGGSS